jgi:GNAT superfamily N-acetyltransferase
MTTPTPPLRVVVLTPEHMDAWAMLFRGSASGCFCRYWHFDGTKNDWLARLALAPETNEQEQRSLIASSAPQASGLLALAGDVAVGWMKLSPRAVVPKLRRLPVYRAHDLGPDDGVLSIGCLLVQPSHRRRGVARALVQAAVTRAQETGARAVEAYPHRRPEALRDEELWMGPLSLFEECGFARVGGDLAYPVLRRELAPSVTT